MAGFCRPCIASGPEERLKAEVSFFSDSLHQGRAFGSRGSQGVAFHICNSFKEAGLWTRVQSFRYAGVTGHNIIAFSPGFYDEYIVVGAYYDGLGKIDSGWSPGADSNASGIAALLSLAFTLAHEPRHSAGIIFVAFDGHHSDLSGSRAFVDRFLDEYKVSMMVNLDILGGTSAPVKAGVSDYLIALGGREYAWDMDRANRRLGLHISYDYYGSSRFTDLFYRSISDQKWFLERKIPAVMFTSGITMDTNRITDTVDKVDFPVYARRVEMIGRWISMKL